MELEVDTVRQKESNNVTNFPVSDDSQNLQEFPGNLKGNESKSASDQDVYEADFSTMGSDSSLYNEFDESGQVPENFNVNPKNDSNLDNSSNLLMCNLNSHQHQHVENHTSFATKNDTNFENNYDTNFDAKDYPTFENAYDTKNDTSDDTNFNTKDGNFDDKIDTEYQDKDDSEPDVLLNMNNEDEKLPEGWVRCGNGLKTEFPNTPKNHLEDNLESSNLFLDFTNSQSNFRPCNSVKNSLMSFDRSAVKELKGGFVAIKASKPLSDKSLYSKSRDHHTPRDYNLSNVRTNNRNPKVRGTSLVTSHHYGRNNTYLNSTNDEFGNLKSQNDSEYKKNLMVQVEQLVRKYRQLAIDAVNAARDEQKRCKEECQKAYSTAYNACLKYEQDLKNTVKFALKEYHHSSRDEYWSTPAHRNEFSETNQTLRSNPKDERVVNHRLLKQDLCYNYEVDESFLTDFENKVFEKFNSFVNHQALNLEELHKFNKQDSIKFVQSLISSKLTNF